MNREHIVEGAVLATSAPVQGETLLMAHGHAPDRLPLLYDHMHSAQALVGFVDGIAFDGERMTGTLHIADRELEDLVRNGLELPLSIGYETTGGAVPERWEVQEVSVVGVPADTGAGTNRKFSVWSEQMKKRNAQPEQQQQPTAQQPSAPPVPVVTVASPQTPPAQPAQPVDAVAGERARVRALHQFATDFSVSPDLLAMAIAGGDTVAQLEAAHKRQKPDEAPAIIKRAHLGDSQDFSIVSLLNAMAKGERCAEVERCEEPQTLGSRQARGTGYHIPGSIIDGILFKRRALNTTDESELIGTNLLASEFVDYLRPSLWAGDAGVRVLSGLVGDVEINAQTGTVTASWLDETTAIAETELATGEVMTLTPKTVGAATSYSRKLMLQATPDVEQLVVSDLREVLERAQEDALLNGTGTGNQPKGLAAYTASQLALKVEGTNGTSLTWATTDGDNQSVVDVVAAPEYENIRAAGAWLGNSYVRAQLMKTEKVMGEPVYLLGGDSVAMRRYITSNQLARGAAARGTALKEKHSPLWYGVWNQAVLGRWSGIDLLIDPYTGAGTRQTKVYVYLDCDVGIRRPKAFALVAYAKHG